MTPDERGQRYKEIKERLFSNYDMKSHDFGTAAYCFVNARDDAQFLYAENKAMQAALDAVYLFVRMYQRAADSGDCGDWMNDDPTYIALLKALATMQETLESYGNNPR